MSRRGARCQRRNTDCDHHRAGAPRTPLVHRGGSRVRAIGRGQGIAPENVPIRDAHQTTHRRHGLHRRTGRAHRTRGAERHVDNRARPYARRARHANAHGRTHGPRRARRHPVRGTAIPREPRDSDIPPDSNAHAEDPHGTDRYSHIERHADPDGYARADRLTEPLANRDADVDTDLDTERTAHGHADRYAVANRYADGDRRALAHGHVNPDRYPLAHGHTPSNQYAQADRHVRPSLVADRRARADTYAPGHRDPTAHGDGDGDGDGAAIANLERDEGPFRQRRREPRPHSKPDRDDGLRIDVAKRAVQRPRGLRVRVRRDEYVLKDDTDGRWRRLCFLDMGARHTNPGSSQGDGYVYARRAKRHWRRVLHGPIAARARCTRSVYARSHAVTAVSREDQSRAAQASPIVSSTWLC